MENILVVYENDWILERVYTVSDRIRGRITDQTLFEERCIKRVADYIAVKEENIRNRRYIEKLINEVASAVIGRNKNEHATIFSELSTEDDEEDEIEFEVEDVLADVESEVMVKEMTALLAQDDHSKKLILGYWTMGNTNNAYISRSLARTKGGNEESHRKAIQRFRKSCRELLTAI